MEEPGQLIGLSDLAKELKISRQTLSNVERKLKKYYPTIVSVDLLFREDELSKSKVFEWFLVNQLKAEFFWRDPYKNEVELILVDC